jgi:hypothetical protein
MKNKKYDERHGGPWDRGHADSYYRRSKEPHYYVGATASTPRIEVVNMTAEEIEAYMAGYQNNEDEGDFKDYGWGGQKY